MKDNIKKTIVPEWAYTG